MAHTRAHIRLNKMSEVNEFVRLLNSDGTTDKYVLENQDGSYRVDARSLLGAMYMSGEHNDDTYLVNLSRDIEFPPFIDQYRV